MTSELDRLIEADITDPTLSNWMKLIDPDEEDWDSAFFFFATAEEIIMANADAEAKYCNDLYLYWNTLTDDQKAAVDRFTGVVWNREYSDFIKFVKEQVQTDKECREYTAPLVEYEEDWSDV